MTREQQKRFKELNSYLSKLLKEKTKTYGFKKKDYMIWSAEGDLYFSLLIDIREKDGHCYCSSEERIKPLWLDDLFWDIMEMPENKNEPLSLCSVGAFALYGMMMSEQEQELSDWSLKELEQCVMTYLEHFQSTVIYSNLECYDSILDATAYQGEIQEILRMIHRQKYQNALVRLQTMEGEGQFQNHGIWFREYAERYCKKQMGENGTE